MQDGVGFGSGGAPFEYTVSESAGTALLFKRISFLALYVLWGVGWLLAGVMLKLILPLLALIPISLWILVYCTWRFTQVEYEYSFFGGSVTVCRVLGGKSRRTLTTVSLRSLSAVYPCDEQNVARIEAFGAQRSIFAASSEDSDTLYALLWNDEKNGKTVLYFDANEKALKIIRYYNASAMCGRGRA